MALAAPPAVAPAAAASALNVSKSADASVLAGDDIATEIRVTNPGPGGYNLSVRDELPPGVSYVAGSADPKFGEPRIIRVPETLDTPAHDVLIWSNISDLPATGTQTISFKLKADDDVYPVGSSVENSASAHLSENERLVPRFDANGGELKTNQPHIVSGSTSSPAVTKITPIKIEKTEPSPEAELMRGVHDQSTVYTLKVENNHVAETEDVLVTDYLPAEMEFLGCGNVDNSAAAEYGSRSLTEVPAITNCVTPETVETVELAADAITQGSAAGVYTKVTWRLADMDPSAVSTIEYRAGIAQRANVMFDEGFNGDHTANLDNNTGRSTREAAANGDSEGTLVLRNYAAVEGHYLGDVNDESDRDAEDITNKDVTAEDLAIHKTASQQDFRGAETIKYKLNVRVSEYVNASQIEVVDVLPDGVCLDDKDSTVQCATKLADVEFTAPSGVTLSSIDFDSLSGKTTVTWVIDTIDANETVSIEYRALMLDRYHRDGYDAPTVSGDAFINTVSLTGTTTTRADVDAHDGPNHEIVSVIDESWAEVRADFADLTKKIGKRSESETCEDTTYVGNDADAADVTFVEGDRVCFEITAPFSSYNNTRNPVITDFLPDHLELDENSIDYTATVGGQPAPTTFVVDQTVPTEGNSVTWTLRDPALDNGSSRFVPANTVFTATFSAIVKSSPDAGEKADITGNLVKMTWLNTNDEIGFLRDQVDFFVASAPPVSIDKSVNVGTNATVHDGDKLTYTLTVTNDGNEEDSNAVPISNVAVWDVLPDTITCADISNISDDGTCVSDLIAGNAGLTWVLLGPIDPGATTTVEYTLTVPENPRVSFVYENTAGVRSYETSNNQDDPKEHFPQENIDPEVPEADRNAPEAKDTEKVKTADVAITKSQTTGITDQNNDVDSQAVIGETVTYTIVGTVPAHTTVYNGEIADDLPVGISLISASAVLDDTNGLPSGAQLVQDQSSNSAKITLGDTYVNDTEVPQKFTLTINARVSQDAANKHAEFRFNMAQFNWSDSATGSASQRTSDWTLLEVVEPAPKIEKSDGSDGVVHADEIVTYTLMVENDPNRPTLHDAVVEDCLPAGLSYEGGSAEPSTGFSVLHDGCGTNNEGTLLRWEVSEIAPGQSLDFTYDVKIDPEAAGANSYKNTASVTGNDLPDDVINDGEPEKGRLYTADTSHTVNVEGATIAKSSDTPTRTIGEVANFKLEVTLPQNVNFYNAVVHDTLPTYIDPTTLVWDQAGTVCAPAVECDDFAPVPQTSKDQIIGWSLGSLKASETERTITIPYSATVIQASDSSPSAGDTVTNSAFFGWDLKNEGEPAEPGDDPDAKSNNATSTVTIIEPNLGIDKAVDKAEAEIGDTVTYTVKVKNNGNSPAFETVVVDTVPSGLQVDTSTITGGGTYNAANRTITWTHAAALTPDAELVFTYDAVLQTTSAPQENTVQVTEYRGLPDGVPNARDYEGPTDTAMVEPILPLVNIEKSVSDPDKPAYVGEPKTWTITATSASEATAHKVSIEDTLPANWVYDADSALVTIAGGQPTAVNPTITGQTLTWSNLGDLTSKNQTIVITFTATPNEQAAKNTKDAPFDHVNAASVTAEDTFGNEEADDENPYNGPDARAETQIHAANLVLTKTGAESAVAGTDHVWTITVKNDGPDTAVGPFKVTDSLPEGVVYKFAGGTGWDCSHSPTENKITCVREDGSETLGSGDSFPEITVTVEIPADAVDQTASTTSSPATASFKNVATVTSEGTHDPDDSNNSDDSTVTVRAEADLEIDKVLRTDDKNFVAGELANYEISVTNNGDSDHYGQITVEDAVPAGTMFDSFIAGEGWQCSEDAGMVTCERESATETLKVGSTLPEITITVRVNSDQQATVENTATVEGTTHDPDKTNNTSTVTKTPSTSADLQITKSHTEGDLVAGSEATYTISVYNAGPSDAQNVVISDSLPSYLSFVDTEHVEGPEATCVHSNGTVTCTLDTLANGATTEFELTVKIASNHTGEVENTATVTAETDDPDEDNNTSTANEEPKIISDLQIVKTGADTAIAGGENITYTLEVTNNGPSDSAGPIVVTDNLPPGMECVTIADQPCSGDEAEFTHSGGLTVGDSFSITVVASVSADTQQGTVENVAQVESEDPNGEDRDPSNNKSTKETEILTEANVSITKSVNEGGETVRAGEDASFTLMVENDGPSDAQNVRVEDELPEGMTLVSLTGPANANCDGAICTIAVLPAGEIVTFNVIATVDSAVAHDATLTNTATVETSTSGDNPDDNTSTADIDVEAWADLSITKTHLGDRDGVESGTAIAGSSTWFRLEVENLGPSNAVGPITITDTLPNGFTFLSAEGSWDCTADGSDVTCTLPSGLIAGTSAEAIDMLVHVDASLESGDATNTATVSSETNDPDESDNTDDSTVKVTEIADVSITKTVTGAGIIGEEVVYTLSVENSGPSVARDVTVVDELPAGLELVEITAGDGWACIEDDTAIVCDLDSPLAAGDQAPVITITALVLDAAYPAVTNTATAETSTTESNEDNNSSTVEIDVDPLVDLSIEKSLKTDLVVGEEATYLVSVTNLGPTEDPNPVTVRDMLPEGLMAIAASGEGANCSIEGRTIECVLDGLEVDEVVDIEIRVAVNGGAYPEVTNTATVSSDSTDSDLENNESETTNAVVPLAVLNLVKDGDGDGHTATWKFTVTNEGPNPTTAATTVTDRLPDALTFVSASGAGWICAADGQLVTCEYPDAIEAGDSVEFVITTSVDPDFAGELTNIGVVSGGSDEVPSKDSDIGRIDVKVPPKISVPGLPRTGAELARLALIAVLTLALGIGLVRFSQNRSRP